MNREIKFRAWNNSNKAMYYSDETQTVWAGGFEMSVNTNYGKINGDFTGMQYTGLKDRNDKEIYEGDIILAHENNANFPLKYVIVFNDKCAFKMRWEGRLKYKSSFYDNDISEDGYKIFEVIGNIYENPELIEE